MSSSSLARRAIVASGNLGVDMGKVVHLEVKSLSTMKEPTDIGGVSIVLRVIHAPAVRLLKRLAKRCHWVLVALRSSLTSSSDL